MPRPRTDAPRLEALEPRTLLAVDPLSPDHELWLAPPGTAVIDGLLSDAGWDTAFRIERAQPHRLASFTILLMHSPDGLFVGIRADDEHLWADGSGGGSGPRWALEDDDSVTLYFDPDLSRDEWMAPQDRAIGFNLAPMEAPFSGSGSVRRAKFVRGDSLGGAPDALPGGELPPGLIYASRLLGTVNDPSDLDQGWTSEVFVPWNAIGISSPGHGLVFGMNFDVIFDNDGGTRNFADNRASPYRFSLPAFVDDHLQGAHSSFADSQAGVRGPINYADVMLVDPATATTPAGVVDLTSARPSPFGVSLEFPAPAGTGAGAGRAWRYEIRIGNGPIVTENDWDAAIMYKQSAIPRGRGMAESIRVVALTPGTTYHASVRARDAFGNLSPITLSAAFTTLADNTIVPVDRIVPSPHGGGLVHERDGRAFVPIGDHLGLSWGYARSLFPGDVWDAATGVYHNFHAQPSYEGPPDPYFFMLQSHGVNTMRVFMEFHGVDQEGNPDLPRGSYWLESPAGEFNPDMRAFLHNLLTMAERYDLRLILSPFDTFLYDETFDAQNPFAIAQGGVLGDIDRFFHEPGTLAQAKARMDVLVSWLHESPYAHRVLAWEVVNEWDSWEWTLNPEYADAREREMHIRSLWVLELARHLREIDPDRLIANPSVSRDPRGPSARLAFNAREFDLQLPHYYTSGSEEPIHNPAGDRRFLAASQHASLTAYWLTSRIDLRPVLNAEWGLTRANWPGGTPGYSPAYTRAEDESLYRAILWTSLAAGQAGGSLRIATDELQPWYHSLTPAMRLAQQAMAGFVAHPQFDVDWASVRMPIRVAFGEGAAFASGDALQAVVYILRDSSLTVAGSPLVIDGLGVDRFFDVEGWDPANPALGPLWVVEAVYSGSGDLAISLPFFTSELAVRVRARTESPARPMLAAIEHAGDVWIFTTDGRGALIASTGGTTVPLSGRVGIDRPIRDATPFITPEGRLNLALLDDRHEVWRLLREEDGTWSAVNLTRLIDAPGLFGGLTVLQTSWGAVHLAGLDARGHVVNVWWTPAVGEWLHTDLTEATDGARLVGSLAGYVTPWDGLNLAGLDARGHMLVYWWAPELGPGAWRTQDLTDDFGGATLACSPAASVTPWGGLNLTGVTHTGRLHTYWWAPGTDAWSITDLTATTDAAPMRPGASAFAGPSGQIELATLSMTGSFIRWRWTPESGIWRTTTLARASWEALPTRWTLTSASLHWLDPLPGSIALEEIGDLAT